MERRTFTVDGLRIQLLFGGSRSKPTVVILHGFGMIPSLYRRLGERLAENHYVLIPDFSGLGKDVSFSAIARVLKALVVADSFSLVGHSMGGAVAISWVVEDKRIERLILVDSAGEPVHRSLLGWGIAAVEKALRSWRHPLTFGKIALSFCLNCLKHPFWMWQAFRLTTRVDLVEELSSVAIPTNLVWAEHDEYFPCCRLMVVALGVEPEVIAKAGHDWIILEPEVAATEVLRLLE